VLSDTPELVGVQETVGCHVELKLDTNDLFYEFVCCVEQDDRTEGFGHVVGLFVGFGDDY